MDLHQRVGQIADAAAATSREAAAVRDRLRGPLSVAVAGRVNAGKSTLLNALLGERLALTDATECTRVVARYVHGQVYSATAAGTGQALKFDRTGDGLRVALPPGNGPILVTSPNPVLRRMTLIDTPGLGSEDSTRVEATTMALGMEGGEPQADAVIYLLRHAHRTDVDALEALRDRWAGNGTAFNVIAVLSRADEIGGGRLDAMEAARRVARRYEEDGRLLGLATIVVPVSGLLAETGATLTEEEFGWLRIVASGPASEVDRRLLGSALFLGDSLSPLTAEIRRLLFARFGLFGLRLAVARLREGAAGTAPALARALIEASGLEGLQRVLAEQFGSRAQTLQAVTALQGLHAIARRTPEQPSWASQLEGLEAASYELAELRALQAGIDGLLELSEGELRRLALILAPGPTAVRLGLSEDAAPEEIRNEALLAVAAWRTLAANPIAGRLTSSACETAARACERIFAAAG